MVSSLNVSLEKEIKDRGVRAEIESRDGGQMAGFSAGGPRRLGLGWAAVAVRDGEVGAARPQLCHCEPALGIPVGHESVLTELWVWSSCCCHLSLFVFCDALSCQYG